MEIRLPKLGKAPVALPHFPTKHQAFIFRAYEYVPPVMIAEILGTTEDNIIQAAADMGLTQPCVSHIWLEKGYITIIRRLWHLLPYEQLLALLGMKEEELAVILREEDFLDGKLGDKPLCEPVTWRELTREEKEQTKQVKAVVQTVDMNGAAPFDFVYDVKDMKFSGQQNFDMRICQGAGEYHVGRIYRSCAACVSSDRGAYSEDQGRGREQPDAQLDAGWIPFQEYYACSQVFL